MVRFKVFIPVLLVVTLVAVISFFFIDTWLKNWIENGISSVTDTKTDITDLKLSFRHSSLRIRRLEVASKEEEFKNAVELDDIVVDFQSLPLLKKRVVIDEFSVKGIQWGTPRKKSGKLPPRKIDNKPSWFGQLKDEAFDQLKKEFDEMPLAKFSEFKVPTDPGEIVSTLKLQSMDAYKTVMVHSQELRSKWPEKFQTLKNTNELETKIKEARKLAENVPQDPQEVLQRIEDVKKTMEFFEAEKTKAEAFIAEAKGDANKLHADYDLATKALQNDFQKAKEAVSLDNLNVGNISRILFGKKFLDKAEEVLKFQKLLRQLLAKTNQNEDVQVRQRAKGRDIIFIVPQKQPSFILEKSDFSVKALENGQRNLVSETYALKLRDLNSSPKLYGKPTNVDFRAEFKEAKVGEALLHLFFDYTKEVPIDNYKVEVKKIAAEEWPMGIPTYFPLRLESGLANASSELSMKGDEMKWLSRVEFSNVDWNFVDAPKQSFVFDLLRDVFSRIKNFHLDIELKRVDEKLGFDIKSDLDSVVQSALTQALEKKLGEFQARLKLEIENRVSQMKENADQAINQYRNEVEKRAQNYFTEVAGFQAEGGSIQDQIRKKSQSAIQDKVKDRLKNLKLPF